MNKNCKECNGKGITNGWVSPDGDPILKMKIGFAKGIVRPL